MSQWIRKLYYSKYQCYLTIPACIMRDRGWYLEKYVIVDDQDPDVLIIRRLPNDKEGERRNMGNRNQTDRSS